MKPTFLGLGAQKCASTWVYRLLETHPEVSLPRVKEIDFFSHYFDYGYQWYERHFDTCDQERCTGEVSPSYFHDERAPARVKAYCPDVKLLVTLRDPVERAVSNHKHAVRLGHLVGDDLSLEAGLSNNPMYVEQGLYGKHLSNWLRHFPREQILVVLMEDVLEEPANVAREIFRFLHIDETFDSPASSVRFNTSFANRSLGLVRLKDRVYQLSRRPGLGWLWATARGMGAREVYRRVNVVESDAMIPPACPDTLRTLRGRFAADVRQLETILGRNLSHWVQADGAEDNGHRISGGGAAP